MSFVGSLSRANSTIWTIALLRVWTARYESKHCEECIIKKIVNNLESHAAKLKNIHKSTKQNNFNILTVSTQYLDSLLFIIIQDTNTVDASRNFKVNFFHLVTFFFIQLPFQNIPYLVSKRCQWRLAHSMYEGLFTSSPAR